MNEEKLDIHIHEFNANGQAGRNRSRERTQITLKTF